MKISLNWLKDYIDLNGIPEKELVERLTLSTCEVEDVRRLDGHIKNTVVGEIVKIAQHPNADKLKVCGVNVRTSERENENAREAQQPPQGDHQRDVMVSVSNHSIIHIVCGGTNLRVGAKVVVALPGAMVKWHGQNEWTELKETEIRGVKSAGMICAAEELEIPWKYKPEDGERPIMILPPDAPVGASLVEYFELNDTVLDIDQKSITHRADLFSHVGMAGEIGAIFKRTVNDERYHVESRKSKVESPITDVLRQAQDDKREGGIEVRIEAKDAVKRYSAFLIENVHVVPSPLWMQNRLRAVGIRPINNLVDATNYVMWEYGMPLHAFDAHKLANQREGGRKPTQFIIRNARNGEKVVSLDGVEHELSETMLVAVDGEGNTIDLPGIMGGKASEVDEDTASILLQAAVFDRIVIRKMSLALVHRTDASGMYERGVDPNLTLGALARTFKLLKETCPDAKVVHVIDDYPHPVEDRELDFDPDMIRQQLGVDIPEEESKGILERLGFGVCDSSRRGGSDARPSGGAEARPAPAGRDERRLWFLTIPTRRKDIQGFQDICEEVGRVYGYDRIQPLEHSAPLRVPDVPRMIDTREMFRDVLVGLGSNEVMTYIFWSERDVKFLGADSQKLIVVQNPLSEDLKYLRTSFLPGMLKVVELNQGRFDSCNVFEVGKVFGRVSEVRGGSDVRPHGGAEAGPAPTGGYSEREQFACVISSNEGVETLFRKMVGVWEEIVRILKLPEEYDRVPLSSYLAPAAGSGRDLLLQDAARSLSPNESIVLLRGERPVGILGVVKQRLLDSYGVKRNVVFMELDAEELTDARENRWEYQKLPQFPSVLRDVALVADRGVTFDEIYAILKSTENVSSVELFDVYEGREVGAGKRSLTFHVEFSHPERTLRAEEVDESLKKTINQLETQLNVVLRG